MEKLVEVTRDMVKSCQCRKGCPTCIYSPKCGNDNKPLHKKGTIFILEAMLKMMKGESVDLAEDLVVNHIETTPPNIKPAIVGAEGYQEFENPQNLTRKGESFYINGNYEEALKCFQKTLKLDGMNLTALKYQGMILQLQGNHAEALESFQNALKIQGDDPETLYYLAVSLYETGSYQESKQTSNKLIKIRKDWDDAWCILAMALQALSDKEGAIKSYNKALSINPLNEDAANNLRELLED
jgi:DEAD/DEAH box helicase domain-containing protein